jgi:hypothetical protein
MARNTLPIPPAPISARSTGHDCRVKATLMAGWRHHTTGV